MNGLALAYIGDAYYELKIRKHLLNKGFTQVGLLHQKAVSFTSSVAQAKIIEYLISEAFISELEIEQYKRGRNASGPGRKNVDAKTYHQATGFEALIGYLYLSQLDRCNEVIQKAVHFIEKEGSI